MKPHPPSYQAFMLLSQAGRGTNLLIVEAPPQISGCSFELENAGY